MFRFWKTFHNQVHQETLEELVSSEVFRRSARPYIKDRDRDDVVCHVLSDEVHENHYYNRHQKIEGDLSHSCCSVV